MFRVSPSPHFWIFVLVALFAAGGGLWLAHINSTGQASAAAQAVLRDGPFLRLPEPKPIADFTLYDANGESFSRASLKGDWTLVFFGFSNCPHICPDTLFQLSQAVKQLEGELPPGRVPKILFVGVDPERDTPDALKRYRQRFDNVIKAVSGPDAQLRALATQLGVHFVVPDHGPEEWYNVDHSLSVVLLNPKVQWVGVFSPPHDSAAMTAALKRFLSDAKSGFAAG